MFEEVDTNTDTNTGEPDIYSPFDSEDDRR